LIIKKNRIEEWKCQVINTLANTAVSSLTRTITSALSAEKLIPWDRYGVQNVGIQLRLVKSTAAAAAYRSKQIALIVENPLSLEITAKTAAKDSL
jgi:hypothetical protein